MSTDTMSVDRAMKIILRPYNTEKTFNMIEAQSKICFVVDKSANKHEIAEAIKILYDKIPTRVNTAITIYGKKAFVQFDSVEKANDLATKIGML